MTDNLMVLDTEYDTFPKRLLAISYVVNKKQIVNYVKHDPNVFQVNDEGDAFKVHKLSNNFLQENGLSVGQVLENFSNELDNKLDAFSEYKSQSQSDNQPRSIKGLRSLASYRGVNVGVKYAEAYNIVYSKI